MHLSKSDPKYNEFLAKIKDKLAEYLNEYDDNVSEYFIYNIIIILGIFCI